MEPDVSENYLEEFVPKQTRILSKNAMIALVVAIILSGFINVLILTFTMPESGIIDHNADNTRAFMLVTLNVFLLYPVVSFALAFLLSFIPYKRYRYGANIFL